MLSLLAYIYGKVIGLRNLLYDKGIFETYDLGARTISIGNITTGGTGKTPLVAYVAGILADRGEKVCILTRGYGRRDAKRRVLVSDGETVLADATTGGDEPVELAQKLLGKKVIVIADADRVAAGEWACRKFGVTAFVLDDGFQHRKVKRDVDIVCVDATEMFGNGKMLPAGRLREPVANLLRADVIVLMRDDPTIGIPMQRDDLRRSFPHAFIFEALKTQSSVRSLEGKAASVPDGPVFGFCGLAIPSSFARSLHNADFEVVGFQSLQDHHKYSQSDIAELEEMARTRGAIALATTAKDAVKVRGLNFTLPCYVLEIRLEIDNPDGLATLL